MYTTTDAILVHYFPTSNNFGGTLFIIFKDDFMLNVGAL